MERLLGKGWIPPILIILIWFFADRFVVKILGKILDSALNKFIFKSDNLTNIETQSKRKRIATLKKLLIDVLRGVLFAIAILMFLDSLGINIMPALTGLGLAGLAISLAAQNLLRDFLNGFIAILEDHFAVGDVVTIAGKSGVVEKFTLRATYLKDLDGNHIIVPNSMIGEVVNATKNWSRAQIKVGVSYNTDIRKALAVMKKVAEELARDFPEKVLELTDVHGILEFEDSAIILRTLIKTAPGEQWFIGREYRLRLKEAFDEEGINIPFPQMDIWVRETPFSKDQRINA